MSKFQLHTIESAPEASQGILQQLQQGIGFVPNLAATMADSPNVLKSYATLAGIFGEGTFSPAERELISMATAYVRGCRYCMAAHSTFAKVRGAAESDIEAVRSGNLPSDSRLAALIGFAREAARQGGAVSTEEIRRFSDAGFSQAQALEVLIGVVQVTLASLVYSMAEVSVDEGFKAFDWAPTAA